MIWNSSILSFRVGESRRRIASMQIVFSGNAVPAGCLTAGSRRSAAARDDTLLARWRCWWGGEERNG
jgi:hypothetical protein